MKGVIDFKELNRIKKKILEEVKLIDKINFENIKTIAGFDLAFEENRIICAGVVLEFPTLKLLESKTTINEIPMNYYPELIAFRDGPAIINTIKELQMKPDIIMVESNNAFNTKTLGLATYVGVIANIPSIGVSKKLIFGNLDFDRIIVDGKEVGFAVKTRDHANPVFVAPGNDLSVETTKDIVAKLCKGHKMPEPLHIVHSLIIKEKK